ncbi:cytochrome P450 2C31-like isoform X2 [Dreissena polymorpha]|uniref:cytochrome P450 2C31-like isoform X2 n=1 Tax=Dreissena polymorpha TaxID=45954 RepID=UPI002263F643|nr:cytochrome P450 2C31-like isoform X2 [Dreissena polymorpha]
MVPTVLLVCCTLLLLLYHLLHDMYLMYQRHFPPGPLSLPLIGNLHLISPRLPHLSLQRLGTKYGKIFSLRMGHMGRVVFVQDIDHINQLYECKFTCDRPDIPIFKKVNQGIEGIGSCPYDKRWSQMTKALHSGLAKISQDKLYEICMHAYNQLFARLEQNSRPNYDPRSDVVACCTAMFSSIVYGIGLEPLDSPELQTRIRYHNMILELLSPTNVYNLVPALWNLPLPMKARFEACLKERNDLLENQYNKHCESFSGGISNLMEAIAAFEMEHQPSDDSVTRHNMFMSAWAVYLASCDTTVDMTLWMMLHLSLNPDVQCRIQEEVDTVITDPDADILQSKQALHYTRATILECLRLVTPIAVGLPRQATRDIEIGGYRIPRGTVIMPNQWNVHHDATHWPEPFQFKPERFLDHKGHLLPTQHIFNKMPFIPFARGKRPCLGQHMAQDILLICFASLLKRYTLRLPPMFTPDLNGHVKLNLCPNYFPLEVIPR